VLISYLDKLFDLVLSSSIVHLDANHNILSYVDSFIY